ncbi:hypothetical protein WG8_1903 [Paenibacillus sp. Aloe-11]|nr:hypothetical protein WG8_1903 [Paenibacillus sp. Aloe-11]
MMQANHRMLDIRKLHPQSRDLAKSALHWPGRHAGYSF